MPRIKRAYGGVLHLPDALAKYPKKRIAAYDRMSSYGQAGGKGCPKLIRSAENLIDDLRKVVEFSKLKRSTFYGVERGRLSDHRLVLKEAARYAKRYLLILVAADLSRFVRSKNYNRHTNNEALPTPEEFAELRELTLDVPLATLLRPDATESERHSLRTKRSGRQGRPRTMSCWQEWNVLVSLGIRDPGGRWEESLTKVAERQNVSRSGIQRLLNSPVPPELVDGQTDLRWKDLEFPARVFQDKYIGRTGT